MRVITVSVLLGLAGCIPFTFDRADSIVARPVSSWSDRDCLTLVLGAMRHNFLDPDKPPVSACVTPYTPRVVLALNRMSQIKKQWPDDVFQRHTNNLLKDAAGLYVDWERDSTLYDGKLKRLRDPSQMDSLIFVATLSNRTWPCTPPMLLTADNASGNQTPQFMQLADWPCEVPDISNFESMVWLVNDRGDTARPSYVWGRRENSLTLDETVLMKFPLRHRGRHLLENSRQITLEMVCLKPDVKLHFPIAALR